MTYLDRTDKFIAGLNAEAYLVGGAVRDSYLGRRVKDADYVIRMGKDDLRRALRKTGADVSPLSLRTGEVVGYRANKRGIGLVEIVLPRAEDKLAPLQTPEAQLGNERHNFTIVVDPSIPLEDDARRRDFTINALYRNAATREVVDPLGGMADLESKLIRTTHESSFADDPLRILRALRFVSVLGFDLAEATENQMREHAQSVTGLTGKGVSGTALDELTKILMGRHVAKSLRLARDTGVLATFIPELAPMLAFEQGSAYHDMTTDEHTFTALDAAAAMGCSLLVRLALLFHDAGKPESAWMGADGFLHFYATKITFADGTSRETEDHAVIGARLLRKFLKRMNADNKLRRDAPLLVERHMVPLTMKVKPTKVRKWRCEIGDDLLADLLKHRLADCLGKSVVDYDAMRAIARMEEIREEAVRMKVPASAKDLKDAGLIDGHDLIEMGVDKHKIGTILNTLLHEVVSQPDRADRAWMLGRAKKLAGRA